MNEKEIRKIADDLKQARPDLFLFPKANPKLAAWMDDMNWLQGTDESKNPSVSRWIAAGVEVEFPLDYIPTSRAELERRLKRDAHTL